MDNLTRGNEEMIGAAAHYQSRSPAVRGGDLFTGERTQRSTFEHRSKTVPLTVGPSPRLYTRAAMASELPCHNASAGDEILLEGMRFYAYHGVNPEEQALGQRFTVDVVLSVDLRQAGQSDELANTVSYSAVYKVVRRIVEGEPRQLIEAVAEEISSTILTEFPPVARVTVTVRKPEVPMKGSMLDAAGVRITRSRADGSDDS
jgi:7,8-dihydroneopterin aldolase/epimerase/oxygenase